MRHGPQQGGLRQRAGVVEVAGGRAAGLAGQDPFLVMAERLGDGLRRGLEVLELGLRQEHAPPIVGQDHPFLAHEQDGRAPVGQVLLFLNGRALAAVVPGELHRRQIAARGVFVADDEPRRAGIGVRRRALGFYRRGIAELQGPEGQVAVVAEKVAQPARAEIRPAPPGKGRVARMIRPEGRGPEPQVPVEVGRDGRGVGGPVPAHVTGPAPDVHLADRPDRPALDQLDHAAVVVLGVDLRAHLRGQLVLDGQIGHHAGLVHFVRERLFAVAVLAHLHGHDAGHGVGVIGGAHHHGVDLLVHFAEHLAEVGVGFGLRMALGGRGEVVLVHVAQCHDVLVCDPGEVAAPAPGHAYDRDIELLIRGLPRGPGGEDHQARARGGSTTQERTAMYSLRHG